jgi:hypothetical protein
LCFEREDIFQEEGTNTYLYGVPMVIPASKGKRMTIEFSAMKWSCVVSVQTRVNLVVNGWQERDCPEGKSIGYDYKYLSYILYQGKVFFVFKFSCLVQYIFYNREKVSLSLNFMLEMVGC